MAVFPTPVGPEINMAVFKPPSSVSLSSEAWSLIWKSESLSASHRSREWLEPWLWLDCLPFCFARSLQNKNQTQQNSTGYIKNATAEEKVVLYFSELICSQPFPLMIQQSILCTVCYTFLTI